MVIFTPFSAGYSLVQVRLTCWRFLAAEEGFKESVEELTGFQQNADPEEIMGWELQAAEAAIQRLHDPTVMDIYDNIRPEGRV